jgi:hypothetical protein
MAEADERTITDAHWRDIERTLPATADRAYARTGLGQIARAKTSPVQLAAQCEEIARQCDEAASALPGAAFTKQLEQTSHDAKKRAIIYREIEKVGRPRFMRQCQLLWLWETVGGELKVSTPRKRKRRTEWRKKGEEPDWPPPTGPVIEYFQAATEAVFGETLGPVQIKKVVADYRGNFSPAIRAAFNSSLLGAAVFGIPFEDKQQVRVSIDESKLFILRDGKLIDKDGNVVG